MTRGLAATKGTDRDFTLLLAGSSVSMVGSRVTTIAYPMLALYLTGSPVAAGWVACAATAPSIVCYMPAGALMDILDPKRVLMLSESGRGIAIAWVVAMVAMGWRSLPCLLSPLSSRRSLRYSPRSPSGAMSDRWWKGIRLRLRWAVSREGLTSRF